MYYCVLPLFGEHANVKQEGTHHEECNLGVKREIKKVALSEHHSRKALHVYRTELGLCAQNGKAFISILLLYLTYILL